jgi:hypothetical protein
MVFFIVMQKDTYKSTGCFDLTCSGFVQTNKGVGLGGAIGPISSFHQQYELNYGIYLVIKRICLFYMKIFIFILLFTFFSSAEIHVLNYTSNNKQKRACTHTHKLYRIILTLICWFHLG